MVSDRECKQWAGFDQQFIEELVPEGGYVDH
jgi:hypothetical protein